jgi:hypothetical protein
MANMIPAISVADGEGRERDEHQEVCSYLLVASDGTGADGRGSPV